LVEEHDVEWKCRFAGFGPANVCPIPGHGSGASRLQKVADRLRVLEYVAGVDVDVTPWALAPKGLVFGKRLESD